MKALQITGHTLIGVGGMPYPKPSGNCFSVMTEKGEKRVVNFNLENIEELNRRGIDFPIEVKDIGGVVVIHDSRIPHEWYDDRFCSICCPKELWPLPQKLEYEREKLQGVIEERDGVVITMPSKMVRSV